MARVGTASALPYLTPHHSGAPRGISSTDPYTMDFLAVHPIALPRRGAAHPELSRRVERGRSRNAIPSRSPIPYPPFSSIKRKRPRREIARSYTGLSTMTPPMFTAPLYPTSPPPTIPRRASESRTCPLTSFLAFPPLLLTIYQPCCRATWLIYQ